MLFLYPLFLFAFFALAIPLILHIWGINVYKKVYLSSIELLRKVQIETNSTNHLRKLLLLLARLALLLFLILAFTQPFFKTDLPVSSTKMDTYTAVLDNSGSMCSTRDNRSFFEVQNIVSKINKPALSTEDNISQELGNGLEQCADYPKKLSEYVTEANNERGMYVFSDFQRSFVDTDKLPASFKDIYLVMCDKNAQEANISIDSVWLSGNFIRNNTTSLVNVQLRNDGEVENKNVLVELKMGGKSVASNMVAVAPRSVRKMQFSVVLQKPEDKFCEVKMDDASWTFDNQFYFVLNPVDKLVVALVNDEKTATHPVKLAFDQEPVFDCKSIRKMGSDADLVQESSLLVVNQTSDINESGFASMVDWAKKGKSVVIVPSDKWGTKEADFLNSAMKGAVVESTKSETIELEVPDLANPFFKNIFEQMPHSANMPTVKPVWKIRTTSETILRTKSGEVALASFEMGKGRVYLFSFGFGEGETFSRNAIFLPVFYRIAENSAKNRMKPYYRVTDESVEFSPKENTGGKDEVYALENGNFKIIPEQRMEGEKVRLFLPRESMSLGIWHVKNKEGADVVQFGLNNDKSESRVDFYSVDELKEKFEKQSNVKVLTLNEFKKEMRELDGNQGRWPLWRYAIVISFLFLLAEILIARYYKKQRVSV